MTAKCPRCGEEMTGGICDNCGFPLTTIRKKHCKLIVKHTESPPDHSPGL